MLITRKASGSLTAAWTLAVIVALATVPALSADEQQQEQKDKKEDSRKEQAKPPTAKESGKKPDKSKPAAIALSPAEVIVETALFAYGGRDAMKNARAVIREEGTIRLAADQGEISGSFVLRAIRKEKSWEDLIRNDLELTPPEGSQRGSGPPPTIKYVMAFNGASVWAAQNNQYITLRPGAEAAFKAQLTHDYTTLLRYKEDGSKLELIGPETVVGLETTVLDLTMPNGDKTRYWLSSKSYRILHLEYQLKLEEAQAPTKFRISYYPPMKIIANTLVPARRVMLQDGKFVQEINLTNITYAAKLNPEIFQFLQESQ